LAVFKVICQYIALLGDDLHQLGVQVVMPQIEIDNVFSLRRDNKNKLIKTIFKTGEESKSNTIRKTKI
jgi:hypothetical protein